MTTILCPRDMEMFTPIPGYVLSRRLWLLTISVCPLAEDVVDALLVLSLLLRPNRDKKRLAEGRVYCESMTSSRQGRKAQL